MQEFFIDNKKVLEDFHKRLSQITTSKLDNLDLIMKVIHDMKGRDNLIEDGFDMCTFNIQHIGSKFIGLLSDDDLSKNWHSISSMIVRFSKELEIKTGAHISSIHNLLVYFTNNLSKYDSEDQYYYALQLMPLSIINEMANDRYRKQESSLNEIVSKIIEKKLPDKQHEIDKIKVDCDKYEKILSGFKSEFSFLSLNQAFNGLEVKKQKQLSGLKIVLIIFGILIVFFPLMFIFTDKNESVNITTEFFKLVPFIFVESILIYYFKIFLNKFNSISDQIIQLETKQAIMQFIESYVDYKKENKINQDEMHKFEDIIFSQISPNLKDIPTSPDLVSLIDGLSKSIRSK